MNDGKHRRSSWVLLTGLAIHATAMAIVLWAAGCLHVLMSTVLDSQLPAGSLPTITGWVFFTIIMSPGQLVSAATATAMTFLFVGWCLLRNAPDNTSFCTRLFSLGAFWAIPLLHLIVILFAFLLPFIVIITHMYGPGDPAPPRLADQALHMPDWTPFALLLYATVIAVAILRSERRKRKTCPT